MDAELKAKWVAALRSGEYKQTKHVLKSNGGGFCCLGVLCDVMDNTKWEPDTVTGVTNYRFSNEESDSEDLNSDIAYELGIYEHTASLMGMNDDEDKSFAEIADYIEEEL